MAKQSFLPEFSYQLWRSPGVKDPLTVVAIQATVDYGKRKRMANAIHLLELAHKEHGSAIYVFPEYFLINWYDDRKKMVRQAESVPGPSTEPFMKFARKTGSYVAVGLFEKSDDRERPYNAIAIFGPKGVVGIYHKMHLWRSGSLREDPAREEYRLFTPGNEPGLFEMFGYKVGVLICADGTFPEYPRALALHGADLLLWPNGRHVVGAEAETTAKANLLPIVVSNTLGNNGSPGGGSSRIVGPWGETLASAVGAGYCPHGSARGQGWAAAELDMEYVTSLKKRFCERTGRRPELYKILAEKV